jgi:hypothetical protein
MHGVMPLIQIRLHILVTEEQIQLFQFFLSQNAFYPLYKSSSVYFVTYSAAVVPLPTDTFASL